MIGVTGCNRFLDIHELLDNLYIPVGLQVRPYIIVFLALMKHLGKHIFAADSLFYEKNHAVNVHGCDQIQLEQLVSGSIFFDIFIDVLVYQWSVFYLNFICRDCSCIKHHGMKSIAIRLLQPLP